MNLSRGRRAALLLLLSVAYVAAGKLGLSLAFVNASASAVWPPTGIALAALILFGLRAWPAVWPAIVRKGCPISRGVSSVMSPARHRAINGSSSRCGPTRRRSLA